MKWFFNVRTEVGNKSQYIKYIKRRIITLCNTNSWHFNSHFGWYFYFLLTRWSIFIRHRVSLNFRSGQNSLLISLESQPNFTRKISLFMFSSFDYLNYSWNNCAKISLRGRFYFVFLRSCFTTLSMDRKRFLPFSWPLGKVHLK